MVACSRLAKRRPVQWRLIAEQEQASNRINHICVFITCIACYRISLSHTYRVAPIANMSIQGMREKSCRRCSRGRFSSGAV